MAVLQILDEFGVASEVATKRFAGAAEQLRRLGSDTACLFQGGQDLLSGQPLPWASRDRM